MPNNNYIHAQSKQLKKHEEKPTFKKHAQKGLKNSKWLAKGSFTEQIPYNKSYGPLPKKGYYRVRNDRAPVSHALLTGWKASLATPRVSST